MQASKLDAESATSKVEQAAEQQLQALANRSEQALDLLKNKLDRCDEKLKEFATFVKVLCSFLIFDTPCNTGTRLTQPVSRPFFELWGWIAGCQHEYDPFSKSKLFSPAL